MLILCIIDTRSDVFLVYINLYISQAEASVGSFLKCGGKVVVLPASSRSALSNSCSTGFGNAREKAELCIGVAKSTQVYTRNPPGWGDLKKY